MSIKLKQASNDIKQEKIVRQNLEKDLEQERIARQNLEKDLEQERIARQNLEKDLEQEKINQNSNLSNAKKFLDNIERVIMVNEGYAFKVSDIKQIVNSYKAGEINIDNYSTSVDKICSFAKVKGEEGMKYFNWMPKSTAAVNRECNKYYKLI